MKKRFLFLTLFSIAIIVSYSQNKFTDTSAPVVAYWKKGEKKKLSFKRIVEKGKANERKIDSSEYSAVVEVLEELKDGYTIKWEYDRVASNESLNLLFSEYPHLSRPLSIVYKTDELGTFKEAINLAEIQSYVRETLEFLETLINTDKTAKNNNHVREVINQFEATLTGRTGIESILMKEIQYFHTFFGAEYSLNKKASGNIELPNAFGGEPFKARIEVDLREINRKESSFTLEMQQFVDREQSKKVIIEIMKKIMPANIYSDAKSLEKEIENFAIEDVCIQKINAGNCWVNSMSYNRKVTAGDHRRLETISLTVK
jgi:hypothetical protein